MTPETKEKLNAQATDAKNKAFAAVAWCKEKIAATWKSGRKGKAICIGGAAVLVLLVCSIMATDNPSREVELEKRRAEAEARQKEVAVEEEAHWKEFREEMLSMGEEFQRRSAEVKAQNDARRAEIEQRRAETEARQREIAAANEARSKALKEKVQAQKQALEDAKNHVPTATGDLAASDLSEDEFSKVFIGDPADDEGKVYAHGRSDTIRVYQSTPEGLLVGYEQGANPFTAQLEDLMGNLGISFDRIVWVDTKTSLNEENRPLRDGFYVRKGMHSYRDIAGGEHVLAQYVEVTDPKAVEMFNAELKRRAEEKRIAEEEAAELADERGAYELNIPIKSFCGFKLGAPPSQVKGLLLHEDGTPVRVLSNRTDMFGHTGAYRLAKPFRLFTHARVEFADNGVGKHLERVVLEGEPDLNKITEESYWREVATVAQMIEKKFGIKFKITDRSGFGSKSISYYWWHDEEWIDLGADSSSLSLSVRVMREIERLDNAAKEASKTSIQFDEDAGADQL